MKYETMRLFRWFLWFFKGIFIFLHFFWDLEVEGSSIVLLFLIWRSYFFCLPPQGFKPSLRSQWWGKTFSLVDCIPQLDLSPPYFLRGWCWAGGFISSWDGICLWELNLRSPSECKIADQKTYIEIIVLDL